MQLPHIFGECVFLPYIVFMVVCRFALVDFGLAQGTTDTQIELLKVAKQKTQKGGGSTGKPETSQGKRAPTSLAPPLQSLSHPRTSAPHSSSSTSSSTSSKPAFTSTTRSKHTKVVCTGSISCTSFGYSGVMVFV